jgi:hypothetical protein
MEWPGRYPVQRSRREQGQGDGEIFRFGEDVALLDTNQVFMAPEPFPHAVA